jgi:hypothetical protein
LGDALARVGGLQGVAAQAMAERRHSNALEVFDSGPSSSLKGSQRAGCPRQRQLTAMAVHAELHAQSGGTQQHVVRHLHLGNAPLGRDDPTTQRALLRFPGSQEGDGISVEGAPTANDLHALGYIGDGGDARVEAEAVEQLRAQFTLLWIA